MTRTVVDYRPPIGLQFIRWLFNPGKWSKESRKLVYQVWVIVLTFLTNVVYHQARRPLTIVKSELAPINCLEMRYNATHSTNANIILDDDDCAWAPFDELKSANRLLGALDSCFLFAYSFSIFLSGFIAERYHMRTFILIGMVGTGVFSWLSGMAFYWNIHSFAYFVVMQIGLGIFEGTGWPVVAASVGNWFDKNSHRATVFGIWGTHGFFGNIIGSTIAGSLVYYNWGLAFIVPGIIIAVFGVFLAFFFVPYPEDVGLTKSDEKQVESPGMTMKKRRCSSFTDSIPEVPMPGNVDPMAYQLEEHEKPVNFFAALLIPGVLEYSLCLFFTKFTSHNFLYWLPYYISHSTGSSSTNSAYKSTPFDIGSMLGAIFGGVAADLTGAKGMICVIMFTCAIPMMFIYREFGTTSLAANIVIQLIMGAVVSGPYSLICTTVSAELGEAVKGNTKAMSTVIAIVDGMGSIGAAIGPLLASLVMHTGWENVFYMMMVADLLALLCLLRVGIKEFYHLVLRKGNS